MQVTPHVHALRIPFEVRPAPNTVIKRFVYAYLQKVHGLVRQIAGPNPSIDPMDLCRQVVDRLGLPAVAANPLSRAVAAGPSEGPGHRGPAQDMR